MRAKRKKGKQKRRQHRDNKGAEKGKRADKPSGRVEACEIERVEEHERGVKPKGTGAMIRKNQKSLKLSLRGSFEIQAQHWPDQCVNQVRNRYPTRGRISAETERPSRKYSTREYIWELV